MMTFKFVLVEALILIEGLTAKQRDAESFEITGIDESSYGVLAKTLGKRWTPGDEEAAVAVVTLAGNSGGERRELDTRKSADAGEKSFEKGDALGRLAVFHFGESEVHGQHVVGDAAEIGRTQACVAFQHEAGADEQNDGQADFGGFV